MFSKTKIVIRSSQNQPPEEEIEEALEPLLAQGFRVKSATTSLAPFGEFGDHAFHIYYVTTVVMEKAIFTEAENRGDRKFASEAEERAYLRSTGELSHLEHD